MLKTAQNEGEWAQIGLKIKEHDLIWATKILNSAENLKKKMKLAENVHAWSLANLFWHTGSIT